MVAGRLALCAFVTLCVHGVAWASCDGLLPHAVKPGARRGVTAGDLIELRDVGHPDANADEATPFAVSPDGTTIAFVISRADLDRNAYCRGLAVAPVAGTGRTRIIDRGGTLPIVSGVWRGMFVSTGYPAIVTPGWSPDGEWIGYLKREQDVTQLWRVRRDGSGAGVITRSLVDIESWAWSGDGRQVIVSRRPGQVLANRSIDDEGRSGFLYDARVTPDTQWRPQIEEAQVPVQVSVIDVDTGAERPASSSEAALLPQSPTTGTQDHPDAVSADGLRAWTERTGVSPFSANRIWVTDRVGKRVACDAAACRGGISRLWWDDSAKMLLFLRREGWNREDTAIYRWRPGDPNPHTVLRTQDALSGCIHRDESLICARENATTPRRIVRISLRDGQAHLVLDLNPEIAGFALGKVERLRWTNDRGLPAWGDLVLPPDYDGRTRLPMIVVQYFSRGFLRGGIGDDYPIYLLAARGFAVLSFEKPPHVAYSMPAITSYDEVNAAGRIDWGERRSILSALERGVDQVVARGFVDPARIGITGLSDGASTVEFALINSSKFAAAAISTCCTEPRTVMTYGGIAWADWNRTTMGYPAASRPDTNFWSPQSLSMNAARIDTPLLMQLADSEALLGLETFTALRENAKPVEMYVFPGELHNKWQPGHRAAVYDRALDWFGFWLKGDSDPAPGKRTQYARWEALRSRRDGRPPASDGAP